MCENAERSLAIRALFVECCYFDLSGDSWRRSRDRTKEEKNEKKEREKHAEEHFEKVIYAVMQGSLLL